MTQGDAMAKLEDDFPESGSLREKLAFVLRYAILAPSNHNSQPWHFVLGDDAVLVCADRRRALPVADPGDRELVMSCGAALFNLRVALSHFGMPYEIIPFPARADPDVLAEVKIRPDGYVDQAIAQLFSALPRRVTNRTSFEDEAVPKEVQEVLRVAASAEGATVSYAETEAIRDAVAELIAEADRAQFTDPRFRGELASWIQGSGHGDGMPLYASGLGDLLDFARPLATSAIRTFDIGDGMAASHRRLAQGSPLLVLLSSSQDDAPAWLSTGQALERVLLEAANAYFDASYLNQPIEIAALRPKLQALMGGEGHPQILLRMGAGTPPKRTPRRPVEDVLW